MHGAAEEIIRLDKSHSWHPFTQMRDWCAPDHEPLVLARGNGAVLEDIHGRQYLDGNASIWTNIHGHCHPRINAAIRDQLERVAHVSFLGTTHEPAARLAARLAGLFPGNPLPRVFFSDDGSTAIEVAIKMAAQYWQLAGAPERCRFVAFDQAYHGDTAGAASLGGIPLFHDRFSSFHFPVERVDGPEQLAELPAFHEKRVAGVVIEPLVRGPAGIRLWPRGMLRELRALCDANDTFLILDEVMTGFGRTGTMFACRREDVVPDFLALAKGLSGGYLPLAATLVSEKIYRQFLGDYEDMKTFFYGHSYTANPLGCAAALASLDIFEEENTLANLPPKISLLGDLLREIESLPHVAATRQCGLIAGIDLMRDPATQTPFPWQDQTGARVCLEARKHGLLTRPIRDTIVLMPPLCITGDQLRQCAEALTSAIQSIEELP